MTNGRSYLPITIIALLWSGCMQLAGPGGEGNGSETVARGVITDSSGAPVECVLVQLIPVNYNPVVPAVLPASWRTYTDEPGCYRITGIPAGDYNIEVCYKATGMRCIIRNIRARDMQNAIVLGTDTLRRTGAVKIVLPRSALEASGYAYIPGTTRFGRVKNASALIDSIPAGDTPAVYYYNTADTTLSHLITSGIKIQPGDTSTIADLTTWKYSKTLYLNTTTTGAGVSGNVTDFPVLVRLSSATFDFSGAAGDGSDLRFTKSDGTPLPYEIELWGPSNAQAAVWVRVDTVYGNNGSQYIVMHWGNPAAAVASNSAAVFDTGSGFQGVWHLQEASGAPAVDATVNHFDGTPSDTAPVQVSGAIGNAQQFDGISNRIRMNGTAAGKLNFPENGYYTLSAWVYIETFDTNFHVVAGKGNTDYHLKLTSTVPAPPQFWEFVEYHDGAGNHVSQTPATVQSWTYLVGKREGNRQYLYCNGTLVDSTYMIAANTQPRDTSRDITIGKYLYDVNRGPKEGFCAFKGKIDEVRISDVALSGNWITLCYMNQKADDRLVVFK